MDVVYLDIAVEEPSFGGLYFDADERAVIYSTDLARTARLGSLVRTRLQNHKKSASLDFPLYRHARFGYADLYNWKKTLNTLLALSDVHYTDIDEEQNRVAVAVSTVPAWSTALAFAEDHGIPQEALIRKHSGPTELLQSTLSDFVRPLLGGLQIRSVDLSSTCSLGFIADFGAFRYFVTAAHCGGEAWNYGTKWYQPDLYDYIGEEASDPPFFTNAESSACPVGFRCRWSDAALAMITDATSSLGQIAKTSGFGSTTITDAFNIVDEVAWPDSGDTLNKMGRVTGWTNGTVIDTCVDIDWEESGDLLLCQDLIDLNAISGDSGAPVFEIVSSFGNAINLYGVLWGRDPITGIARMSAMINIEYELGNLTTF